MNKPSQFIFLTTNKLSKEGQICNTAYGYAISGKDGIGMGQHIYILSDDEIRDNDHVECLSKIYRVSIAEKECLYFNDVATKAYRKDCKKIIATTNPELWGKQLHSKPCKEYPYGLWEGLVPSILQSDIEYIISLHNGKGKEVNVMDSANLLSKITKKLYNRTDEYCEGAKDGFILGYDECLQDNADKKFTLEDAHNIMNLGMSLRQDQLNGHKSKSGNEVLNDYIQSLSKGQSKSDTVMVDYERYLGTGHNGIDFYSKPKLKDGNICIVR